MNIETKNKLIIISSPSGAGKTTLVNLLSKQENFKISISHTTRKPRDGEIQDKDYYFSNEDKESVHRLEEKFDDFMQKDEYAEKKKLQNICC